MHDIIIRNVITLWVVMDLDQFFVPERFKNQNRSSTIEEELREARNSFAYWWFETLCRSDEYREFCRYYPKRNLRVSKVEIGRAHV